MPISRGTYTFVNRQSGTAMEMGTTDHSVIGKFYGRFPSLRPLSFTTLATGMAPKEIETQKVGTCTHVPEKGVSHVYFSGKLAHLVRGILLKTSRRANISQ